MSDSRSEVVGFDSSYDLKEFLQPKFDAECGLRYKYYESKTKNPQLIQFRRLSPKTTLKYNKKSYLLCFEMKFKNVLSFFLITFVLVYLNSTFLHKLEFENLNLESTAISFVFVYISFS